jgi:hypothetical protein
MIYDRTIGRLLDADAQDSSALLNTLRVFLEVRSLQDQVVWVLALKELDSRR